MVVNVTKVTLNLLRYCMELLPHVVSVYYHVTPVSTLSLNGIELADSIVQLHHNSYIHFDSNNGKVASARRRFRYLYFVQIVSMSSNSHKTKPPIR
jgi:hypothetical protein